MFERILVALDLNHPDHAEKMIAAARVLGGQDGVYHLTSVIPPIATNRMITSFLPRNYDKLLMQEMQQKLEHIAQQYFAAQDQVTINIAHGTVYEELIQIAKEKDCQAIVVAAVKPGGHGLGPNAARVARNSGKSVLIVR